MIAAHTLFTRYRREVFLSTWAGYAGLYFARKVFGVIKSPLKAALHVDDFELSHLWTAFLVAYMVGQFVAAWLGTKTSSRLIFGWGMLLSIAASVATGLSFGPGAYYAVLGLMVVQGLAQATGWAHGIGMINAWTRPEQRGRAIGLWGTCYQLGAVGGKAFAAFVFGLFGLAAAFIAPALLLSLIVILFYFWGHREPEVYGLPSLEVEAAEGVPDERGDLPFRVLRLVVALGLTYLAFKFLRYALDSWSALIMKEHFEVSTSTAGYLSAVYDCIGFIGVLGSGWLSDRTLARGRMGLIFYMTVGCFLSALVMWWIGLTSLTAFVILLGLVGLMATGPDALLSGACAMDVGTRKQAAVAAGVINGLGSLGPILQEPAIGWLKTYSTLDAIFALLAGVAFTATISTALLWLRETNLRRAHAGP